MAYQIKCDGYILYDPRDDELMVNTPRCSMGSNKVGSASFTILPTHPYFSKLHKLKSVIEVKQDNDTIFRGRMTGDSQDINNILNVDVEGALAYTNDSIIPPFSFPDDFPESETAENVVECFLGWILEQHNAQVQPWQQLKLGNVTVADKNNYISRSSSAYSSTWDLLKSKLFGTSLGGHMYVRYETDGNYVDYVDSFELTNTQRIVFGENMTSIVKASDATQTYSAIFPQGKDGLNISALPDGDLTEDLVKSGIFIYSKSAVEQYGWICVPINDSTWADVTIATNLQNKAMDLLVTDSMRLSSTITFKAVNLHYTDDQVQSFKPFRNVLADSPVHGIMNAAYELTNLDIDIFNPQNTTITVGVSTRTLNDINVKNHSDTIQRVQTAEKDIAENRAGVSEVKDQLLIQSTQIVNDCESIIMTALESYVETGDYESYKETVSAQLQILSDEILMNFRTATEHIVNVDGDLQSKFTELYRYISFAGGNITLGSNENAITLTLENDMIVFKKNGLQFGWWDGVDFHTGNIVVEVNERAQFGNFAFIPRSDGSLMFLKVGG